MGDTQKRRKPEMRSFCRNSLDFYWSPWPWPGRGSASVPYLRYLSVSRHFNEYTPLKKTIKFWGISHLEFKIFWGAPQTPPPPQNVTPLSNTLATCLPPSSFVVFFVLLFLIFFSFLFSFSSFSACYVPYFSSTGTQTDKYWFTCSAILFKFMSLWTTACVASSNAVVVPTHSVKKPRFSDQNRAKGFPSVRTSVPQQDALQKAFLFDHTESCNAWLRWRLARTHGGV